MSNDTLSTSLFGHLTPNAHWQPEPTIRGTWSILSTCLVTFSLCVWSAVHVNCEPGDEFKGEPKKVQGWRRVSHGIGLCFTFFASRATWRKICWVVLGLLLPDMVFIIAFAQCIDATRLTEEENARRKDDDRDKPTRESIKLREWSEALVDLPKWTIISSFYAMMGGFAFEIPRLQHTFLPGGRRGLCITYEGIRYLLKHLKVFPYLDEKDIEDKSKGSGLAKLLVCLQALWFVIQCVNRLAGHLTLSLLELSTFCHVICTLMIYACWWHKPLNIERPTSINNPEAFPALALMTLSSGVGYAETRSKVHIDFGALLPSFRRRISTDQKSVSSEVEITKEYMKSLTAEFKADIVARLLTQRNGDGQKRHQVVEQARDATQYDPLLLRYAAEELLRNDWLVGTHHVDAQGMRDITTFTRMPLVDDRIESLESIKYSSLRGDSKAKWQDAVALPILFTGPFYGAIHLLAWDASFRTTAEQILWRVCAVGMAAPAALLIFYVVGKIGPPCLQKGARWIKNAVIEYGIMVFAPLYLLGRVYILVECFLQLPYLPESAFEVPAWTQYWPHLN